MEMENNQDMKWTQQIFYIENRLKELDRICKSFTYT